MKYNTKKREKWKMTKGQNGKIGGKWENGTNEKRRKWKREKMKKIKNVTKKGKKGWMEKWRKLENSQKWAVRIVIIIINNN